MGPPDTEGARTMPASRPDRIDTPIGSFAITWSERGIRKLEVVGDPPPSGAPRQDEPIFGRHGIDADTPLDLHGTPWQLRVWAALREIPPGETVTYGELARRLGRPHAARAVGAACAANPVAVLVPCHRVVPSSGGLGGYRWGVERKRRLLDLERRSAALDVVPRETDATVARG
jgi:O-6-methylguanine DNA methyltransferase